MHREITTPRPHWKTKVEESGLVFHHTEGRLYWDEGAFYRLSIPQVDILEDATNELARLCMEAVEYVVKNDLFRRLNIPPEAAPIVKWSRENKEPAVYGRMDLAYDGVNPPKLLEYKCGHPHNLAGS